MNGVKMLNRKVFVFFNNVFLVFTSLICILPFFNIFAISLSSKSAAASGIVGLWPIDFTLSSYQYVLSKREFFQSFGVTVERVLLGCVVNMFLTIITSYPLSKGRKDLRARTVYVWIFVITMLFTVGLIPYYMVINALGLLNSIWVLVLPGALPVYNTVILLNFFRGLPKELEESAFIDGAGHWTILWSIFVPLSKPALTTILLFTIVNHWNSWFDGMIFIFTRSKFPLQTFLRSIVIMNEARISSAKSFEILQKISDRTVKCAQIFIGMLPILAVYPFLQRYFITGLVLGSVKE